MDLTLLLPLLLNLLSGSFLCQGSLSVFIKLEVVQDRCFRGKALENIQQSGTLLEFDLINAQDL